MERHWSSLRLKQQEAITIPDLKGQMEVDINRTCSCRNKQPVEVVTFSGVIQPWPVEDLVGQNQGKTAL